MQVSKIVLAIAATLGTGAALAAAPTKIGFIAGASAIQANLRSALGVMCAANNSGYTMSVLPSTNGNIQTYVCASTPVTLANYASATYAEFQAGDAPFEEIRSNVDAGSFSAMILVSGQNVQFYNPTANAIQNIPAGAVRLGGALDTQANAFPAGTISSNGLDPETVPAGESLGVAQAFGVGVSQPLYVALYNSQLSTGTATVAKPLPSTCGVGNALTTTDRLECIPTVSKGQMATIMADNAFNSAYSKGVEFLTPGANAGVKLHYARRVDTSGTQSSAQNYFLGLPCATTQLSIVPEGAATGTSVGANMVVYGLGGTGNVRTLLNDTTKHSIGVLSGENVNSGTWKWVRVQGAAMGENATPSAAGVTNRAAVENGSYDFYFETVYVSGGAEGDAFWPAVKTTISALPSPLGVGLISATSLATGFNKGGQTCAGNSSN